MSLASTADDFIFFFVRMYVHACQLSDMVGSLTHISLASHFWDIGKECRPRSDAAFCGLQGLHCLLTGISIRNRIEMKKYTRHP